MLFTILYHDSFFIGNNVQNLYNIYSRNKIIYHKVPLKLILGLFDHFQANSSSFHGFENARLEYFKTARK